jgi:hypothetical protein
VKGDRDMNRGPIQKVIVHRSEIMELAAPDADTPIAVKRLFEIGRVKMMIMDVVDTNGDFQELHVYFAVNNGDNLDEYSMPLPPRLLNPQDHDQLRLEEVHDQEIQTGYRSADNPDDHYGGLD